MKRLCCVGALMTALLGTGLHFLYTWQPIALFGLFAPVNESVWEHLKLLVWPFLLVCGLLAHWAPSRPSFWAAACGSLLDAAGLAGDLVYGPVWPGGGIGGV